MSLSVRAVRYGSPAFAALAEAVGRAKEQDPFSPVTMVVPRGTVGLAARRRLAAGPGGIVNVRHLTMAQLAADLALPRLAATGRRPLTPMLLQEAVRAVLSSRTSGVLAAVRDQPGTVRALARTASELEGVSSTALASLAALDGRSAEVVDVVRAARALLAGRFSDTDLLRAAASELARRAAPGAVGPLGATGSVQALGAVVVHLPTRLRGAEAALLRALAEVLEVTVLVGTTGRPTADGPARAVVELLGGTSGVAPTSVHDAGWATDGSAGDPSQLQPPAPAPSAPERPEPGRPEPERPEPQAGTLATEVYAAPSADAEVLVAVRRLLRLHADGMPLERMALLHGGSAPYPRLVEDTLAAADVPHHGPAARPLSATATGRLLLGYLELAGGAWRREDVVGWLAAAPVRHRGQPAPTAAWDVVSCDAGVVAGLDEWRDRLTGHASALRRRAAWQDEQAPGADEDVRVPEPTSLRREADACDDLREFVAALAARLDVVPERWVEWAEWCRRLVDELLGGSSARSEWPTEEVAAYDAVSDVLVALGSLDEMGRRPGLADVRTVLQGELEAMAPQTSRFGNGLLCGRVADAVGLDLDVVWVLGLTDGAFPPPVADDVLLPDRLRERVADEAELPRRGSRRAEGERDLAAALSGPSTRILSYPVGDQRQGGALRPARPLLDALGELAGGRRLYARDLPLTGAAAAAAGSRFVVVPSYAAAVIGEGTPTSAADWELRDLARWVDANGRVERHFLAGADEVLRRGLSLRRGRRSGAMTRYDGRVGDLAASLVDGELRTSATTLESFARCPRRYFLSEVLGISVRDRPEALLRITALDRGVAVHRVLERFVTAELLRTAAEGLGQEEHGDTEDAGAEDGGAEADMERIAAEVFAELEARRLTGRGALWQIDRAAILASLRRFVTRDREYRRALGATPEAVEQTFGDSRSPVVVPLGGGRQVAFRGRIDRIDRTPAGGLYVLDYKSGSPHGDPDGPLADPLAGGTRLQLAVYGAAARQRYRPEGPVLAGYWYLGGDGALSWCEVSEDLEAELVRTLATVTGAIGRGAFPGRPGDVHHRSPGANCATCPFDAVCPGDRQAEWQRKRGDAWIADYVALAEPADA